MHAEIIAVDVRRSLQNGSTSTFITFLLPDLTQISAQVDAETAQQLIEKSEAGVDDFARKADPAAEYDAAIEEAEQAEVDPSIPDSVEDIFSAAQEAAEEPLVEWEALSDEQLSPALKRILKVADIPASLPATELVELIDAIQRQQAQQQAPQAPAAPTVGKVQHLQPAPRRTVPKDAMGYPIVDPAQQVDRDPGEVAVMGSDEDGVPQA